MVISIVQQILLVVFDVVFVSVDALLQRPVCTVLKDGIVMLVGRYGNRQPIFSVCLSHTILSALITLDVLLLMDTTRHH